MACECGGGRMWGQLSAWAVWPFGHDIVAGSGWRCLDGVRSGSEVSDHATRSDALMVSVASRSRVL